MSDYVEALVFPESAWSQTERDSAALYAATADPRMLYTKADVKRVLKPRAKKSKEGKTVTIDENNNGAKKRGRKPKIDNKATSSSTIQKKTRTPKRKKKEDESSIGSICSHSSGESSFTYSMKSADNSDIGSGFPSESERDDTSTIATDYSTTDIDVLPKRMKHKDLAQTYLAKRGKRFKDLDNGITYKVISVCKYDNSSEVFEDGKKPLAYQLCFKYIDAEMDLNEIDDIDDIEISLCSTMMSSDCDWVEWLD